MLFNFGICKCLHTGPGNTGMNYEMGGTILSKTVKEKYLGVTMNANMKVSEHCRIAASKGNQVFGMIRRNITYHRCQHGLRKMRESARNDISRIHANFARAHKCEQNTAYMISTHAITLYKM